MQQQKHQQINIEKKLEQLNKTLYDLNSKPSMIDTYLKDYISTYVQCHSLSDEFFVNFCENNVLNILLQLQSRVNNRVCILESLNLLLANTKQANELVYFLSQPSLHEYLFENSPDQNSEYTQYFGQLLKTILLKISESDRNLSLIKLFYNIKFPHFPIFTHVTILASDKNQLVKVTAQQCILIIIGLVNRKALPFNFLVELPMLAMILKIMSQYQQQGSDHEGIANYLADLFYQLRNYKPILLIINNFIFNYIAIRNLPQKYDIPLRFFCQYGRSLSNKINQVKNHQHFSKNQVDDLLVITATHLRTLIKYLTNKYLSGCYLVNLQTFSGKTYNIDTFKYTTQYKLYTQMCKQFTQILQPQKKKLFFQYCDRSFISDLSNRYFEYQKGPELQTFKQNYLKNSYSNYSVYGVGNAVYSYLYKKTSWGQSVKQWVNMLNQLSGLQSSKNKSIFQDITGSICPSRSIFICEYCCITQKIIFDKNKPELSFGQKPENLNQTQTNFNNIKLKWGLWQDPIKDIYEMSKQFLCFINQEQSKQQLILPKIFVHYSHFFLMQIKQYFQCHLYENFTNDQVNGRLMSSPNSVIYIAKICRNLHVKLQDHCATNFAFKLNSLHSQIQGRLLENNFDAAVKYMGVRKLIFNRSYNQSKIYFKDNNQQKIISILVFLECLQKIMNPKEQLLFKFYESQWRQKMLCNQSANPIKIQDRQLINQYSVLFSDNTNGVVSLWQNKLQCAVYLKGTVNNSNQQSDTMDICLIDKIERISDDEAKVKVWCKKNEINCFTMQSTLLRKQFLDTFIELRRLTLEISTAATLDYLQFVHKQLCSVKIYESSSKAIRNMQTPTG